MTARALLEAVADEMLGMRDRKYLSISIYTVCIWADRLRAIASSLEGQAQEPTREMAEAFRVAHDLHAAARIPKIYAKGQREEANIIVGLRAALAAQSKDKPA